jgi:hypothetical protein
MFFLPTSNWFFTNDKKSDNILQYPQEKVLRIWKENCNCGYCFNDFLFNLGLSLANINCNIEMKLEDFHRMVLSSQFC